MLSFFKKSIITSCKNQRADLSLQGHYIRRFISQWDIVGAVLLERKPIIVQSLSLREQQRIDFLKTLENKKSHLSDHEIRQQEDKIRAEKLKKGQLDDMDAAIQQTAQDFEDSTLKELQEFNFAPRNTEADAKNDKKSLQRKLDERLLLVVKEKLGENFVWCLPQTIHEQGETLRQTAERALKQICKDEMKVKFYGNAPVGFYKYKYPKDAQSDCIGAKLFFFKASVAENAQVILGSSLSIKEEKDYYWLLQSELESLLKPSYCKAVNSIIFNPKQPESISEIQESAESIK